MASLLKVRDGKLEWTQIVRSNDLFLGVPHNFVQFTCLQEIMAGWLDIECGSYNHVSDSLHMYDRDRDNVLAPSPLTEVPSSSDSLALPLKESEQVFGELEERIEQMIKPGVGRNELQGLLSWEPRPEAYRNILAVLVAEALRRRKHTKAAMEVMSSCTNPVYQYLWSQWVSTRSG